MGIPPGVSRGAFIVTLGADRRESGTHYTPKSLTEPLSNIRSNRSSMRSGGGQAADGMETEIAARNSGAQSMRHGDGFRSVPRADLPWLGERLVEAWSVMEAEGSRIDDEGCIRAADDAAGFEPLSRDTEERAILARRLIAERCLYGVDKNPLAVELAKLSLWLTTLAKGRPSASSITIFAAATAFSAFTISANSFVWTSIRTGKAQLRFSAGHPFGRRQGADAPQPARGRAPSVTSGRRSYGCPLRCSITQ